jgi:hypothetical protein
VELGGAVGLKIAPQERELAKETAVRQLKWMPFFFLIQKVELKLTDRLLSPTAWPLSPFLSFEKSRNPVLMLQQIDKSATSNISL